MYEDHNETVYEILDSAGLVGGERLHALNASRLEAGRSLADAVIEAGDAGQPDVLRAVADFLGLDFLDPPPAAIPQETAELLGAETARMYGVVPLRSDGCEVHLAALDPFNPAIADDLTFVLEREIRVVVADPAAVAALLAATYGEEDATIDEIISELGEELPSSGQVLSESELAGLAEQTPIIRFVNLVLQQAVRDQASDIHFEPFEDQFRIRYRIDGALYEMAPPPCSLALPVISRLKVLANLNISENRVPQDGRIKITLAGRPVDLRVSTLPTRFGESVVLRVLDKAVVALDLDHLGMPEDVLGQVRGLVVRPNGIFIVTGPTGSGKTTTLYSALREINKVECKVLTAEDPVEYEIDGIMQVAVNHQVGLDFARALRAFLRQDPDIILVGEIRDLETARIAVQASLTGHLVLSTLHTNDAPGAITRLVDMGLEPFLISASLEAVLAQRLVRRICRDCRTAFEPDPDLVEMLAVDPAIIAGKSFFHGAGCQACGGTGYRGRTGLFEMMAMNDAIRELVTRRASTLELRREALVGGMRGLRDDGLRALFDGATTLEEILKYT